MKIRLSLVILCALLICSMLQAWLIVPIHATDTPTQPLALTLAQNGQPEPGQDALLTLSLPTVTLAGGFFTLYYDQSLFLLEDVQLLQANDALTLTYHDKDGKVNVLIDAMQNVEIQGALLSLRFATSEEAQPGNYPILCSVPSSSSFYVLGEDGSAQDVPAGGCQSQICLVSPPLPTCPARYLACQETNPADGSFYVRLCALTDPDATLVRGTYGFLCSVTDGDGTREMTLGGSPLLDRIEGGSKIYTAAELGGNVFTSTLSLPATGTVKITLTPYVRMDDQTIYAGTYTLIYTDGAYISTSLS